MNTMLPLLRPDDIGATLRQDTLSDSDTATLHNDVASLPGDTARDLITACDASLHDRAWGRVDRNRIGVVKLLVALLPGSYPLVREWMFRTDDPYFYELQFTFCCFLSDILLFTPPDAATADAVLRMATEYLDRVPSDEAYNAFMAADMLGDHWTGDAGIEALVEVAQHSRNPVGRKAALGALEDAARRGKLPPHYSAMVLNGNDQIPPI
ncbi:MAG: hypothetical protein H7145_03830 [Akkermansiaceae bacterium]|nr:hypothetical protein [Armatimonadota bacterium]